MNSSSLHDKIGQLIRSPGLRADRGRGVAEILRMALGYRWVGLYDVFETEIAVIAWSGPSSPAFPRFPRTQGLCGAAAASGETVVANDVSRDPRYLTTLGDTRAEMIVPVIGGNPRRVVGLIDVESERVGAFADAGSALLESCASLLLPLWQPPEPALT